VLFIGAIVLALAFFSVSLSFARALPDGQMFLNGGAAISNSEVSTTNLEAFSADQLSGALLLDAPEVYDAHFGALTNNTADPLFTHFVFAFRTVIGLVALLIIISFFRRSGRPKVEKKTMESVEAAAEEKS